jgi:outer membrane usher protein
VETDFRGYTVVPFVTAYRHNTISLDTETLPDDADVTTLADRHANPRCGGARQLQYPRGHRVLMTLTQTGNRCPSAQRSPPRIRTANLSSALTARPISPDAERGKLSVSWGQEASEHCVAEYALTDEKEKTASLTLPRSVSDQPGSLCRLLNNAFSY